ncbi:unnamed protein product [Somion occarium]|uniref:T6SS Phospholipase effector Tle1-like catalytic domain-containing protein n=2 Tax=Somion occarium TaxID=3059160 RepID=A0ABP1E1S0_9APHY
MSSIEKPPSPTSPPPSIPTSPPKMNSRTLVLCFDGTSNQFDGDNTNVVRFYSLLKKDDEDQQLCYYQPGIGTYFQPGVVSPLFQWGAKVLDEAVAWYLDAHVRGGYQFLMQNYRPDDKICIFGFSRGAYTARALAGLLHKIGLLPKDNPEQIPFAYKLFKKTDAASLVIAAGFKQTFCRSVQIDFVGVWDTVASVGLLMNRTLPFTTTNTTIKTFRHALSLDEHRAKFRPNLYHRPSPDSKSAARDPEHASPVLPTSDSTPPSPFTIPSTGSASTDSQEKGKFKWRLKEKVARLSPRKNRKEIAKRVGGPEAERELSDVEQGRKDAGFKPSILVENQFSDEIQGGTDVLEVWFAGCHSDVGGGSVPDGTKYSLANITLRWMVRQVVLSQCGINFDNEALNRARIPNSVFTGVGFPVTPPLSNSNSTANPAMRQTQLHPEDPTRLVIKTGSSSSNQSEPNDDPALPSSSSSDGANPFSSPKMKEKDLPSAPPALAVEAVESFGTDVNISSIVNDPEDAISPEHDQLKQNPFWWLLEIIPLSSSYQDGKGKWHKKFGWHLGRGRHIPGTGPKFHSSVQLRLADPTLKYIPRAHWDLNTQTFVD